MYEWKQQKIPNKKKACSCSFMNVTKISTKRNKTKSRPPAHTKHIKNLVFLQNLSKIIFFFIIMCDSKRASMPVLHLAFASRSLGITSVPEEAPKRVFFGSRRCWFFSPNPRAAGSYLARIALVLVASCPFGLGLSALYRRVSGVRRARGGVSSLTPDQQLFCSEKSVTSLDNRLSRQKSFWISKERIVGRAHY